LLLDSLVRLELELLLPKEAALLSINWLNLPQLEREFFSLEALETEKLKDISVFTPVKKVLTLPQEFVPKVVNSRELEEEDDGINL